MPILIFNYFWYHLTRKYIRNKDKSLISEVEIFHFGKKMTSEEVIAELDKKGYEPASIYELLEYAEKDWNGKDLVVALGSVWRDLRGHRRVPDLDGGSGRRGAAVPAAARHPVTKARCGIDTLRAAWKG